MLNSEYRRDSLTYVQEVQEVQERIRFEFVETLVWFMQGWLTFYHSGHEVALETRDYITDLLQRVQKTRENFMETRVQAGELKSRYMESKMVSGGACKNCQALLLNYESAPFRNPTRNLPSRATCFAWRRRVRSTKRTRPPRSSF